MQLISKVIRPRFQLGNRQTLDDSLAVSAADLIGLFQEIPRDGHLWLVDQAEEEEVMVVFLPFQVTVIVEEGRSQSICGLHWKLVEGK